MGEILYLPTSRIKTGIKNYQGWMRQVEYKLAGSNLCLEIFDYDWVGAYITGLDPKSSVQSACIAFEDEYHSI